MRRPRNPLQPVFASIALLLLTLSLCPAFGGAAPVSAAGNGTLRIHVNNVRLCNNRCTLIIRAGGQDLLAGSLQTGTSSTDDLDMTIHVNNVRLCNNRCALIIEAGGQDLLAGSLQTGTSSADNLDMTIHVNNVRLCNNRCLVIVNV